MVTQRLVSLGFAAFLASSCILPVQLQGSVTFGWTIGKASDRKACTDRSATAVRVVVRDDVNDVVADDDASCDSFRSRYLLDRGWYDASLTLVDSRRSPVSETQPSNAFYVSPRVDTFVEVAFEAAVPPL
jgi:hypothetical protein